MDVNSKIEEFRGIKMQNTDETPDLKDDFRRFKQDIDSKLFEIKRRIEIVEDNGKMLSAPESKKPISRANSSVRKSIESNPSNKNSSKREEINEEERREETTPIEGTLIDAAIESENVNMKNITITSKKLDPISIENRIDQLEKMFNSFK